MHLLVVLDDSEWKQKLSKEKKQTRTLERSIKKLKTELSAVDRVGNLKKHSIKCESVNSVINSHMCHYFTLL